MSPPSPSPLAVMMQYQPEVRLEFISLTLVWMFFTLHQGINSANSRSHRPAGSDCPFLGFVTRAFSHQYKLQIMLTLFIL